MSHVFPEVLFPLITMSVGWFALWPLSSSLGRAAYHVSALPVGLVAWAIAVAASSLSGRPLDALSALVGVAVVTVVVRAVARFVSLGSASAYDRNLQKTFMDFAGVGILVAGASLTFGLLGFTRTSPDSYRSYWPQGVDLYSRGIISEELVASRSPLIPGMNAVHVMLGSDWAYAIYPLLAMNLLVLLAVLLLSGPLHGVGSAGKPAIVGGVLAFLALNPMFINHAFYVHSHMLSALYLLLSLGALQFADRANRSGGFTAARAWLIVGGIAAAGLVLARPDGLAYVFVPVALALSILVRRDVQDRSTGAFFAPLLLIICSFYAAAFAELGMWSAAKLDGMTVAGLLLVLGVAALLPRLLPRLGRWASRLADGPLVLTLFVVLGWLVIAAIALIRWDRVSLGWTHAAMNLFGGHGGWGYSWHWVAGFAVLSLLTGDAMRRDSWNRPIFMSILLFVFMAALIHGVSHSGRLGVGDSFNRVASHVFPVALWYVGCVLGAVVGRQRTARRA